MKSPKHIEQLAKNIHFRPDDPADKRILAAAEAALSKRTFPDMEPEKMRLIIMKNPMIRIAAAAVVVVTCLVGVSVWRTTGSGIALADVLARVEQVKTFRSNGSYSYTRTRQMASGKPYQFETRYTAVVSQEYGYRINVEGLDPNGGRIPGTEYYVSLQKKTYIEINTPEKRYLRLKLDEAGARLRQEMFSQYSNPGAILKGIMACKYENLGRSTIDGVDVEGFRATDPNCRSTLTVDVFKNRQVDVKLWVGVETRLPVRSEGLSSGLDEMGNTVSHRLVSDFQWDVPVTAADFEPPPVPDGYAIVDNAPDVRDEETAIQGLKQCVELFGSYLTVSEGQGPREAILAAFEKSETPAALRLKQEVRGLTEKEKLDKVSSAAWAVQRFGLFYLRLVQDKKAPFYFGTFVTPKDTDKVVLRWKVSDSEYRVIYGDLHTETVSTGKLAELEAAVLDNPPGLLNEETAILGLKQCVELLGNYLETISYAEDTMGVLSSAFEKSETPAAKKIKELTGEQKYSSAMDAGKPIFRLIWFYAGLVQDKKDPAYYGKTVTPKDADKVLLRWKVSDSEYRVIFGDLHAETVSPERLAELEKALPK